MARKFRDDGVSEVLGFVLTFALSAIFLMIALTSFNASRNNTEAVVTGVELKAIADRVASHIVDAGIVAQEYPNATMVISVPLPQEFNGLPYYVTASPSEVIAATMDGSVLAKATTYKLDAITGIQVSGTVYSSNERLLITYTLNGANRDITIHEE